MKQLELFEGVRFEPVEPNVMRRVFGPGPDHRYKGVDE